MGRKILPERGYQRKGDVITYNRIKSITDTKQVFQWPLSEWSVNLWTDRIHLMLNKFFMENIKVAHSFCLWSYASILLNFIPLGPSKETFGLFWLHSLVSHIFLGKVAVFFPISLFCHPFYSISSVISYLLRNMERKFASICNSVSNQFSLNRFKPEWEQRSWLSGIQ